MSGDLVLAVNPTAGKGRAGAAAAAAAERLRAAGCRVREVVGDDADDALVKVRGTLADGAAGLVVVGGDGMVHLGVQAVAGTPTPLGIIAAGTGNDFATALGLPCNEPLAAADVVAAGRTRAVDAVRAADKWWCCVLAAGFDSAVNERANRMRWPKGRRRYDLAIVAELRVFRPLPFVLTLDGQRWETEAMLVAVGNAPSYGAGMRICPDAVLDDGLLEVVVVGPVSRLELVKVFPKVFKGTHVSHPAVSVRRAAEVRLEAPEVTAYADGERYAALPFTSTCVAGALQVFAS